MKDAYKEEKNDPVSGFPVHLLEYLTLQEDMRDRLYTITSWADVIIIMYSVTDINSYNTSLSIYNTILSTLSLVSNCTRNIKYYKDERLIILFKLFTSSPGHHIYCTDPRLYRTVLDI